MPTYLYCLTRDSAEPPAGLLPPGGGPVRSINAGPLAAWVATVPAAPEPSAGALRHHDTVTSAALAAGSTPLPVRFGETFEDDAACVASLAERRDEILAALARVEGRVEMTVAIRLDALPGPSPQPVDSPKAGPGRRYLEQLRVGRHHEQILRQQGHVLSRPIVNAVRALVRDERAALRSSPPIFLVSHLIDRDSVADYRRLASAALGVAPVGAPPRAAVRGPTAPYSFAGLGS